MNYKKGDRFSLLFSTNGPYLRNKIHFASLHIEKSFHSTPDWLRRGIRLSLALIIFGLLGHAITFPEAWGTRLQSEVKQVTRMSSICTSPGFTIDSTHAWSVNLKQACNWAAITCIVSTVPKNIYIIYHLTEVNVLRALFILASPLRPSLTPCRL